MLVSTEIQQSGDSGGLLGPAVQRCRGIEADHAVEIDEESVGVDDAAPRDLHAVLSRTDPAAEIKIKNVLRLSPTSSSFNETTLIPTRWLVFGY